MAIVAGTCVGVLYFKLSNGTWIVGVHNGKLKETVTSKTPLLLVHVGSRTQFFQKNPKPLIFFKTQAEFLAALKNPPKNGTPFGVRIATKVTASPVAHGCIAFLQNGKTAHNGKFIEYIAPNGTSFTKVNDAIQAIKTSPGGRLRYLHWNLRSIGGGRFQFVQETTQKSNVTNLRLLP